MKAMVLLLSLITIFFFFGCQPAGVDRDCVPEDLDNCAEIYNPEQSDDDGDGLGDPCDADTPQYGLSFQGCYDGFWYTWSDLHPFHMKIEEQVPGIVQVTVADFGYLISSGEGPTNGDEFWVMTEGYTYYDRFTHSVEGSGDDNNGDDLADYITGLYNDDRYDLQQKTIEEYKIGCGGEWWADRVEDEFCDF